MPNREPSSDRIAATELAFRALAGARSMALVLVSRPALLLWAHPIPAAAMPALAGPQLRCDWSAVAGPLTRTSIIRAVKELPPFDWLVLASSNWIASVGRPRVELSSSCRPMVLGHLSN
jgi:hypothetical protein